VLFNLGTSERYIYSRDSHLGLLLRLLCTTQGTLEKRSTTDESGHGSSITGVLQALLALDVLLVLFFSRRLTLDLGAIVGDVTSGLVGLDNGDGQGDRPLLLAVIVIKMELALEGLARCIGGLVERDGSKANDLISRSLLVVDINVEETVLGGIVVIEDHGLIPFDALASVLLDGGLLETLLVIDIKRELSIGVVLAKPLNIGEGIGVSGNDVDGVGHGGLDCWGDEEKKRVLDGCERKKKEEKSSYLYVFLDW